jgi:hypothetical protein
MGELRSQGCNRQHGDMSEIPPFSGMTALEFYMEELRASLPNLFSRQDPTSARVAEICRGVLIAWDTENDPELP